MPGNVLKFFCPFLLLLLLLLQIELNIVDMDIEDTAQCTADYLDLGGGQPTERLCGLMLRNTKRK